MGVWIEIVDKNERNGIRFVTPLVGVWIEITITKVPQQEMRSLPLWECGLKLTRSLASTGRIAVTPLVGVWIEITDTGVRPLLYCVTPLVGVWIEIIPPIALLIIPTSLPLWECGLKFFQNGNVSPSEAVTPLVGVWIEIIIYL